MDKLSPADVEKFAHRFMQCTDYQKIYDEYKFTEFEAVVLLSHHIATTMESTNTSFDLNEAYDLCNIYNVPKKCRQIVMNETMMCYKYQVNLEIVQKITDNNQLPQLLKDTVSIDQLAELYNCETIIIRAILVKLAETYYHVKYTLSRNDYITRVINKWKIANSEQYLLRVWLSPIRFTARHDKIMTMSPYHVLLNSMRMGRGTKPVEPKKRAISEEPISPRKNKTLPDTPESIYDHLELQQQNMQILDLDDRCSDIEKNLYRFIPSYQRFSEQYITTQQLHAAAMLETHNRVSALEKQLAESLERNKQLQLTVEILQQGMIMNFGDGGLPHDSSR